MCTSFILVHVHCSTKVRYKKYRQKIYHILLSYYIELNAYYLILFCGRLNITFTEHVTSFVKLFKKCFRFILTTWPFEFNKQLYIQFYLNIRRWFLCLTRHFVGKRAFFLYDLEYSCVLIIKCFTNIKDT